MCGRSSGSRVREDLYRRVILDRYQAPAHRGSLQDANACAEAHNPLCGDEITISARVDGNTIEEVAWEGMGCSILYASADLMADALQGRTIEEADRLFEGVEAMLQGSEGATLDLGELAVLDGVRRYPARVRCALLPWKTLREALGDRRAPLQAEPNEG